MGPLLLIWRLTARDLRRRLTQSVLEILVIAAATSTLTLAFALNGTSNDSWSTTHAATAGPTSWPRPIRPSTRHSTS